MQNKNKFTQIAQLTLLGFIAVSLSGCYLSIGGGKKRRGGDDDTNNIVVTTGGSSAPPVIVNNVPSASAQQPVYQQPTSNERPLQPTNRNR